MAVTSNSNDMHNNVRKFCTMWQAITHDAGIPFRFLDWLWEKKNSKVNNRCGLPKTT